MRVPALERPTKIRILPNASVDIVLYLSETARGEGAASIVAPPHRSYVVGSTLRSFVVHSAGWRHVIGASLRPAGVLPLLGVPAPAIGESLLVLTDLLGRDADRFEDQVLTGAPEAALERMAWALMERGSSVDWDENVAHRGARLVHEARGRKRIDELARDLNVSGRGLERQFLAHVGLTPKLFSRLVRFDRAVRHLAGRGQTSWAAFAIAHGYADQAHFINEFREFAGVTPTEFEAQSDDSS
jgi:AraC-like DNA-binding protein